MRCSTPAWSILKVNSATFSNAAHDGDADDTAPADAPTLGVRVALVMLRAYKLALSPLFTGSCRFLPSCSDYAAEAIRLHGLLLGSWLAAKRLGRCHPLCAGGYDPVPPRN
ncbi:MAG: membrane protein insertion efficiency factor YidD [Vicinamibacterales bacterium]